MALEARGALAPLLVVFLAAAAVAGCVGPNTPVQSEEELSITITPEAQGRPYDLYVPVLLMGLTPSPAFEQLDSASPDVSWTIVVHENKTLLRVQGTGNATLASSVTLDGVTHVAAYNWSSPSAAGGMRTHGSVPVLLFGGDSGAMNDTVRVLLHYAGNQSRPVAHTIVAASRTCDLDAAVVLDGSWQEFTVRDVLGP